MRYTNTILVIILYTIIAGLPVTGIAVEMDTYIGTAYRSDHLNWNIASDGLDVRSELTWKDIKSYQVQGGGTLIDRNVVLRVNADYGWILHGDNQDSDYGGNQRTQEWSRSNNDAGSGRVYDVSSGLGYRLMITQKFSFTPMAGYSYHVQHFTMRNGVQTVAGIDPVTGSASQAVGAFPNLDSSYRARWQGPWLGADISVKPFEKLKLTGNIAYHLIRYRGEANWNLRTDFAHPLSFLHTATGTGITISTSADYSLNESWGIGTAFDYKYFSTRAGTDTTFNPNGSVLAVTRLNEVNWQAWVIQMRGIFRF